MIEFIVSMGIPYALSIFDILPISMESNALDKSTKIMQASRFVSFTRSIILRTVKTCPKVDLL